MFWISLTQPEAYLKTFCISLSQWVTICITLDSMLDIWPRDYSLKKSDDHTTALYWLIKHIYKKQWDHIICLSAMQYINKTIFIHQLSHNKQWTNTIFSNLAVPNMCQSGFYPKYSWYTQVLEYNIKTPHETTIDTQAILHDN